MRAVDVRGLHRGYGDVRAIDGAIVAVARFLPSYWIVAETMGQAFDAGLDAVGVLVLRSPGWSSSAPS